MKNNFSEVSAISQHEIVFGNRVPSYQYIGRIHPTEIYHANFAASNEYPYSFLSVPLGSYNNFQVGKLNNHDSIDAAQGIQNTPGMIGTSSGGRKYCSDRTEEKQEKSEPNNLIQSYHDPNNFHSYYGSASNFVSPQYVPQSYPGYFVNPDYFPGSEIRQIKSHEQMKMSGVPSAMQIPSQSERSVHIHQSSAAPTQAYENLCYTRNPSGFQAMLWQQNQGTNPPL